MKLEDFVRPVCLNQSCLPTLQRHVFSHLLYLTKRANSHRQLKLSIVQFYRPAAVDLLALHGVTEKSQVHRLASGVFQ